MSTSDKFSKTKKLIRYISIYGFLRTFVKAAGRVRSDHVSLPGIRRGGDIAVIGCGQFAFGTIGYFLWKRFGRRIGPVFDISFETAKSFGRFYGALPVHNVESILADPHVKVVYIASSHSTHVEYALRALEAGKVPYIEKPIAVEYAQARRLFDAVHRGAIVPFAGYNRPHAPAMRRIRELFFSDPPAAVTMSCFVAGHFIPKDHWYKSAGEGTRICGNLGHWIDLAVHILAWRGLPEQVKLAISYADDTNPEENISVTLTTVRGDLISLIFSAHAEPFEGVTESISFQSGRIMASIFDFRRMVLVHGECVERSNFFPKDVGHEAAICQPYSDSEHSSRWAEVEYSTLLMLKIMEMASLRETNSIFTSN